MEILHSNILGTGSRNIIILHGFLGMGSNWKTHSKRWELIGYQVHLIDLRNHGKSFWDENFDYNFMVEDLFYYVNNLDLKKIILIGHSMGGKVAMLFSILKPEFVDLLIISDISPKDYESIEGIKEIREGLIKLNLNQIKTRKEADLHLEHYVKDFGTRQFLLKNLYRSESGKFSFYPNIRVLEKSIPIIEKFPYVGGKYNKPTLFLKGEKSNYINIKDDQELIISYFPSSEIIEINEAGHWIHVDQPDLFFDQVNNWIDKTK